MDAPAPRTITRLVGVYDADGTLRGELAYWVGKRLGRTHCSLCDITHGSVRERPDWQRCRESLPVPFETFHRDDQPADVRAAIGAALPAVVAIVGADPVVLVGPDELERCDGSPEALADAISAAAERAGLDWSR